MSSTHERRLGRGLDSFSHLFFSSSQPTTAPETVPVETPASVRATPDPVDAQSPATNPKTCSRTLLVTGFCRGCGKTRIAAGIAHACRDLSRKTAEWQLGPGVIVPRHGDRFGLPVPHPSDERAFEQFAAGIGGPDVIVLDGPPSLVADADPFALSAEEFLVIALPGAEGAAEGYACVKEIATALPDAAVRVVVNRAASPDEAREVFHRIAGAAERHLGRAIRSYGGLPTLVSPHADVQDDAEGRALLFSRVAHAIASRARRQAQAPSFFDEVWLRLSQGRG